MFISNKAKRSLVRQQGVSDCGIACLATIARYHGCEVLLENLRNWSGTLSQGTTLLGLKQAAARIGLDAEGYEISADQLSTLTHPCILPIRLENLNHYWVCFGSQDGSFEIGDPFHGYSKISVQELMNAWTNGICLKITPTEDFRPGRRVTQLKQTLLKEIIWEDLPVLFASLFLGLIITVLGLSLAVFSQKLVDEILPYKQIEKLTWGIAILTLLVLSNILLSFVRGSLLLKQGRDFNERIVAKFYGTIMYLPLFFFDSRETGELISRLKDTGRIQAAITGLSGSLLTNILILVISTVVVFVYSTIVGFIYTLSMPLFLLLAWKLQPHILSAQKGVMQTAAQTESGFIDSIQGMQTIKSHNKENVFKEKMMGLFGMLQGKVFELGKLGLGYGLISGFLGVIFSIGVLATLSFQVVNETLSLGEMVAILTISGTIIPALSSLSGANIQIQEAKVAFDRMIEFVGMGRENSNPEYTLNISPQDYLEIKFKNVGFSFPGRNQLLTNLNLQVTTGELILIKGNNGAGKSTALRILQKFYSPTQGAISIDGISLSDYDTSLWREMVGVVPQEIKIFQGTVLENITLLPGDSNVSLLRKKCLENGLDNYFQSLPFGYATVIGEDGINLSGGQIQLIGLARALFMEPRLLLLDEASSSVDPETEKHLFQLLQRLKTQMAIIMVAHKTHNPVVADRIYRINDGHSFLIWPEPKEFNLTS